jgi:glycerophosphoryl diester phosphodiesterase
MQRQNKRNTDMTHIASHRGGSHLWPENSKFAFSETAKLEVEMVEFDVHQTRDSRLVVHHDASIDRMTDGKGAIADLTYDELMRHVILGTRGERIPTLGETIAIFEPSKVDLRLEIKTKADGNAYEGMESRIAAELMLSGMLKRSMVTSFSLFRLEAFVEALGMHGGKREDLLGLVWLCSPLLLTQLGSKGLLASLNAYDIREIALKADTISAAVLDFWRGNGITVHGWAAHTREAAQAMFRLGVASFTTDRPDLAIAARPA